MLHLSIDISVDEAVYGRAREGRGGVAHVGVPVVAVCVCVPGCSYGCKGRGGRG